MDFMRLARLFSSPRPMGLSILCRPDPLRTQRAEGTEGPAWPRAAGWTRPAPAAFSSSLSQLPLGSQGQKNTGSLSSDPGQPSPTATQEEGEEESFGLLSEKYSSRRMFHKSTAQLYNLRLKEQNIEEDEGGELEPKPRRGPRNTPYWYFFQCKRLIREGKVGNLWTLLLLTPASIFCEGPPCRPVGCSGLLSPLSSFPPVLPRVTLWPPGFPCPLLDAILIFLLPAQLSPGLSICVSSCLLTISSPSPSPPPSVAWNSCSQPRLISLHFVHLTNW